MDKTEAQLCYSNALMNSSVGRLLNLNQVDLSDQTDERRDDQQRTLAAAAQQNRIAAEQKKPLTKRVTMGAKRGGDGNGVTGDSDSQNAARAENISYFLSLLRSYSAENGDDLHVLELNALRDLAFIIESHLFHICFIDQLDQAKAAVPPVKISRTTRGNSEIRQHENEEQKKTMLLNITFTYTAADVLPLSVRPYLLNSEAERDALFALSPSYRTRSVHRRIALEHGVKFPAHHSLSQPPLSYADLQNRLFGDDGSQQIESSSTQEATNSDAMEICTATNDGDSKKLSPPVFNAFQKSIGPWNRTISFVAKFVPSMCAILNFELDGSTQKYPNKGFSFQFPREKYVLLQQTFRQLNHHYVRTTSWASGCYLMALELRQLQQDKMLLREVFYEHWTETNW
uniref:Uncharacterized protein n=1 Tax=Meloidogyne incognita TaxID=6306 RepID=A0A914KG12_MELIC